MYKLIKIDEDFSDEQWQQYFTVLYKENFKNSDKFKENVLNEHKTRAYENFIRYVILDENQRIAGDFDCYVDDGETENIGPVLRLDIYLVSRGQTEDEIVKLVLNKLVQHYDNSLKIRLISYVGEYDNWAEKWGGTFKIHLENYLLKFSDIDKNKLSIWTGIAKKKNPDLKLRICEMKELTENELVEYLHLWNTGLDSSLASDIKASNVIKKYNFKYQIQIQSISKGFVNDNKTTLAIIAYDQNDKMAGFSHLDIDFKMPKEYIDGKIIAECLEKDMTYVKPEYRGKGLGKWMNAELYLKLLESYVFEEIETNMVTYNSYIQNINREFGYKKLENSYRKEYILDLSEIKKLLQEQKCTN